MSFHQKAGQIHSVLITDKSFSNMMNFKYLGITITNQNCIHEEIKWRLNLWNACYHSHQESFAIPSPHQELKD
jgi:hypothetical protein